MTIVVSEKLHGGHWKSKKTDLVEWFAAISGSHICHNFLLATELKHCYAGLTAVFYDNWMKFDGLHQCHNINFLLPIPFRKTL
jgi:hypothetical protein